MVSAEPEGALSHALRQMSSATPAMDDEKVLGEFLSEKARALFRDDIQFKTMMQNMVANTKEVVDELASDHRKQRINQEVVIDELCRMADSGKPAFLREGMPIVIMSEGLRDTKAGAFSQLNEKIVNEKIVNAKIPFYGSYTETDPAKNAQEGVDQFKEQNSDLIFLDTSDGHKQEAPIFEDMLQVDQRPKQMGVSKESTLPLACPAPGSEDIEQDDDEDDNDDDDDDDDDDEEEEDFDSKVAAGDEEEDLEAEDDEGEEEEAGDEGEAEDNGEDDGEEGGEEDDVDGDEEGDEDPEEEDEENGDQDPEDDDEDEEEVEEESEEDVEDLEPPKKKQK